MYGVYDDAALTSLISVEGSLANPDDEANLDGDAGDTAVKALWAAVIQSTLTAGIDAAVTTVVVDHTRFKYTDQPVIKIGTELLYITAGFGTTSLTVVRGWNGTTAATHALGDRVYMAYDADGVYVTCRDNEQVVTGDESSWVTYCLDDGAGNPDGSYSSELSLGNINWNEPSVAFHRKAIVPASTAAVSKTDLIHDLQGVSGTNFTLIALDS